MTEKIQIDKEELANVVGHHEDTEYLKKDVSIFKDKKQYTIRIPTHFAEEAKIDSKEDKFRFILIKEEETFTIEGELIRGKQ